MRLNENGSTKFELFCLVRLKVKRQHERHFLSEYLGTYRGDTNMYLLLERLYGLSSKLLGYLVGTLLWTIV